VADEIVDTFHEHDKRRFLDRFEAETYEAIDIKLSLNPVLHAFQLVVNQYNIDKELIAAFLKSMRMDLDLKDCNEATYQEYIYGSAEVVGLMCLKVFLNGDEAQYQKLKEGGRRLGAAFQKVNFLRDIKSDYLERGRVYFPGANFNQFSATVKASIEDDIAEDFRLAYQGIKALPLDVRLGVYLAYVYYLALFNKIKAVPATKILNERIRVPDPEKLWLLLTVRVKGAFRLI
jgi:phytoene/squalene synthetase